MYVLVRLNFTPLGFETTVVLVLLEMVLSLNFTPLGFETQNNYAVSNFDYR